MRLTFPKMDARRRGEHRADIVDAEHGTIVGYVSSREGEWVRGRRHAGRVISLFDRKYVGRFETHEECLAFAKGIEAAINHLPTVNLRAGENADREQEHPRRVAVARGGRHDGEGTNAKPDGAVVSILPEIGG